MKRKKKNLLITIIFALAMVMPSAMVMAVRNDIEDAVNDAVQQKTFYHYNVAYAKVIEMPETTEKYKLMDKLSSVQSIVWTDEVNKAVAMITDMTKSGSGKTYDEIISYVSSSKLSELDKGYLLGELTSWGRKLVWTDDYVQGVNTLNEAWNKKTSQLIEKAESSINLVKNKESREYLRKQLKQLKDTQEAVPVKPAAPTGVTITSFSDNFDEIKWNKVDKADWYYIYISYNGNGEFLAIKGGDDASKAEFCNGEEAKNGTFSFKFPKPLGNNKRYYRVTAVRGGLESDFSEIVPSVTKFFPLLYGVPQIPNVNYVREVLSEDKKYVYYDYLVSLLPTNYKDEYVKLLQDSGWVFRSKDTIKGYTYYQNGDKLMWFANKGDYFVIYGLVISDK